MNAPVASPEPAHACVIHLGFSGSRDLFPGIADPVRRQKFTDQLTAEVTLKLAQLRQRPELHLHEGHVFVGIAQMAIGGDWVFADACDRNSISLQVFLPQPCDEFLAGKSPRPPYTEDFTPPQREQAQRRLRRASVLEQRVVSVASDRSTRFADTSAAILRAADIAVILQPRHSDGKGKPGGTNAFADQALRSGKPLYALTFWIDENQQLHVYEELRYPRDRQWPAPRLPSVLPAPALSLDDLVPRISEEGSALAQRSRRDCERDSAMRLWRHLALILAAGANLLVLHLLESHITGTIAILAIFLSALLSIGGVIAAVRAFFSRAPMSAAQRQRWTDLQLAAELAQSARAFGPAAGTDASAAFAGQSHDFRFMTAAGLPPTQLALARTLAFAHLRRLRDAKPVAWEEQRDRYVRERLEQPATGQIALHRDRMVQIRRHVRAVSIQAGLLGGFTTLILLGVLLVPAPAAEPAGALAALALILPACALLLLAHRCVLKHRLRSAACAELQQQLEAFAIQLQRAASESEFLVMQAETESRLLAAMLNGYRWRRSDD